MKITIFWLAWSGKSTVWKLLTDKLNYTFMSSWNIMRQWAEAEWLSIYDFEDKIAKNDDTFDVKLDNKVREYWVENDNFLFESRLAWYFIPDSFKIYLKCDEETRYKRIQNREATPLQDIIDKNKKRETELEQRYAKIYPHISFPPREEVFDIVIDVANISPQEIVDIIVSKIWVKYMEF